eukprot:295030-Chlamydomonas_euryale.AAC.6
MHCRGLPSAQWKRHLRQDWHQVIGCAGHWRRGQEGQPVDNRGADQGSGVSKHACMRLFRMHFCKMWLMHEPELCAVVCARPLRVHMPSHIACMCETMLQVSAGLYPACMRQPILLEYAELCRMRKRHFLADGVAGGVLDHLACIPWPMLAPLAGCECEHVQGYPACTSTCIHSCNRAWQLYRSEQRKCGSLQGHQTSVESVTFDHNEELVAAGAASGSIKIFDLDQAKGVAVRVAAGEGGNSRAPGVL